MAAVTAGMIWAADGSDMMGSLRNPAGWNGLYSLRPTAGLMEEADARDAREEEGEGAGCAAADADDDDKNGNGGKLELPYPISTAGPIGRSPGDCAALMQTMAEEGNLDMFDASAALSSRVSSSSPPFRGKRVGWLSTWGGAYPTEPAVLHECEGALRILEAGTTLKAPGCGEPRHVAQMERTSHPNVYLYLSHLDIDTDRVRSCFPGISAL